jgi:hypothetical protein
MAPQRPPGQSTGPALVWDQGTTKFDSLGPSVEKIVDRQRV